MHNCTYRVSLIGKNDTDDATHNFGLRRLYCLYVVEAGRFEASEMMQKTSRNEKTLDQMSNPFSVATKSHTTRDKKDNVEPIVSLSSGCICSVAWYPCVSA
jgi:hypothetical protein